jgi:hypothetical protein
MEPAAQAVEVVGAAERVDADFLHAVMDARLGVHPLVAPRADVVGAAVVGRLADVPRESAGRSVVDGACCGVSWLKAQGGPFGIVEPPSGCSSVGRASASQAEGREFEPRRPLRLNKAETRF